MEQRFNQLVEAHGGRLSQLARMLLGRRDEADDVVQDTLVKLWQHLPKLEPGAELGWLLVCTRNACLDALRGGRRRGGLLRRVAGEPRPLTDESPEARLAAEQRAALLRRRIAALPEPGRSLLILRDIQDIDVATVAKALDLSENQVKVYTFRARRRLRRALEDNADEHAA